MMVPAAIEAAPPLQKSPSYAAGACFFRKTLSNSTPMAAALLPCFCIRSMVQISAWDMCSGIVHNQLLSGKQVINVREIQTILADTNA